ncbi:hypothetical protein [Campylobacter ureolyticus]|uniref:hypothetical protein n=1 Tax=Campylobacter ureolyticus TaxID=827 RepID=UPI0022B346AE|nr:hypothetical protein [Campylobacter ureolyticus]MCZ6104996.1 hypothetical protein [Campylobacter ureolyticus]MCZ6133639.1 hypothetical protein [Campylobacter ureolyticus]MCZ6157972.1 hypothetical protein [Campylobacter ureolyticus]
MRVFFILMLIIIQIFANTLSQISQSQAKQEWDAKKPYQDTIIINGKTIEFRAKRLPNGKINIGTYYEKK